MNVPAERDPVLQLVDAVLRDPLGCSAMYVGRRRDDGDATTFVIQAGEEGRHRVGLPDLDSDVSIEEAIAEAHVYLSGCSARRCHSVRCTSTRSSAEFGTER